MKEVYDFLKKCGTYFLATVEDDQPRVRPFGTIDLFDGELTFQTGKVKPVSKQLHANPKVEICAFHEGTWLRIAAEAIEDERIEAAEHMLAGYPSLQSSYKPGDGNCEVFKLVNAKATFSSFTAPARTIEW